MKKTFDEFINLLLDVERNPVVDLAGFAFVKYNWTEGVDWEESKRESILCACPLTQVAMKSGLTEAMLIDAQFPSDAVQKHLSEGFDLYKHEFDTVWREYDNGKPLEDIALSLSIERNIGSKLP